MPTTPESTRDTNTGSQDRARLSALIGERVMDGLGEPGSLRDVQVRHLWEDRYRVNVFIGQDAASALVAHSYFLVADGDGNIVSSTPEITRSY
jgi:hypothetical protein